MHPDVLRILYSEQEIDACVSKLAERINEDYKGRRVLVVGILKGACIFMSDLIRKLDVDVEIDFMIASSYGSAAKSSGVVRIIKDLERNIEGMDILLVEDVLDTGLTLKYLAKNLRSRKPNSVEIAVLLRKDVGSQIAIEPKYLGLESPDEFLVGYGLDYSERYRNLPYIGVLSPEVYEH